MSPPLAELCFEIFGKFHICQEPVSLREVVKARHNVATKFAMVCGQDRLAEISYDRFGIPGFLE